MLRWYLKEGHGWGEKNVVIESSAEIPVTTDKHWVQKKLLLITIKNNK